MKINILKHFKPKFLLKHTKKTSKLLKIGLLFFCSQFLLSVYLFIDDFKKTQTILEKSDILTDSDIVFGYSLKLIVLSFTVGFSLILSFVEIVFKWDYKIEKEIINVFIYLSWIIYILVAFIK